MNEKQQQLLFDKGITNVPSDILCSDNALEESMGLTYDGEHKVIQSPETAMSSSPNIIYVHKIGTTTNYIAISNNSLIWGIRTGAASSQYFNSRGTLISSLSSVSSVQVTSIGKTLIATTTAGLAYFLWSDGDYKKIGNAIPDISASFKLANFNNNHDGTNGVEFDYTEKYISLTELLHGRVVHEGLVDSINIQVVGSVFKEGKYEDAKAGLIGLVTNRINEVHENKRFLFPFWVRYAIRLYDGTYTHISNPILLLPTVRNNWDIYTCDNNGDYKKMDDEGGRPQTNYRPWYARLYFKINNFESNWSDIISGIDIFVSEEQKSFDMEGKWTIQNTYILPSEDFDRTKTELNPLFGTNRGVTADVCAPMSAARVRFPAFSSSDKNTWRTYYQPKLLSSSEIVDGLIKKSTFYKIAEIDYSKLNNYTSFSDATNLIENGALVNLTSQPLLPNDDYFSRATMAPKVIKSYNNRLHIANVERGFFNGFTEFSYTCYRQPNSSQEASSYSRRYYVHIKTESGTVIVMSSTTSREIANTWFYYPDPRAFKVDVFENRGSGYGLLTRMSLKQHPYLNGAYAFVQLPSGLSVQPGVTSATAPTPTSNASETLHEHLFVSEVNNPYSFNAKGDHTIRMGGIIGLATQTMALNEQEHGIHPLTVFSEKGISLMRLGSDGTYLRSDEISREVCNNAKSITETDGPVFFSSDKGLMVVSGSEVKCVSEQLSGKSESPFQTYLETAYIAYDYRDSLLWIFNGSATCWIYNMKSGTYSHYMFDSAIESVVNNYPDYLMQSGTTVYSLIDRVNINYDENPYTAQIITRPMKLENGLALKGIMQILHIKNFSEDAQLALTVQASDDLTNWHTLNSLRGKPWKYYKFQYDFSSLIATDRFAGSVLITQERRTNKLR